MVNEKELELLSEGKMLPVMEYFYSIQGEGYNTGKAAAFLRIGGCDVGCDWCDVKESWNPDLHPLRMVDEVIEEIKDFPAKAVVITGGEPLTYNLDYLTSRLHQQGMEIYLETSGSQAFSGEYDWICLSPKKLNPPRDEYYAKADELKVIIHDETDFLWAEENKQKAALECILYLQPEWSRISVMMQRITDYVQQHPQWKVSLQTHKYMNIP